MGNGKETPLETQLEWTRPDNEATLEELLAHVEAERALERRDRKAIKAYIQETRKKLGFV